MLRLACLRAVCRVQERHQLAARLQQLRLNCRPVLPQVWKQRTQESVTPTPRSKQPLRGLRSEGNRQQYATTYAHSKRPAQEWITIKTGGCNQHQQCARVLRPNVKLPSLRVKLIEVARERRASGGLCGVLKKIIDVLEGIIDEHPDHMMRWRYKLATHSLPVSANSAGLGC